MLGIARRLLIIVAAPALHVSGINYRAHTSAAQGFLERERPTVFVATLGDPALGDKDRLLAEASISNKRNYVVSLGQNASTALMESGEMFPLPEGWHGGWKKVDFLLSLFDRVNADWLMWVDLDIFITRHDYDVRNLLEDDADAVIGPVGTGNFNVCVEELNTGIFFVRRNPAGLAMLRRAKDLRRKLGWESEYRMEQAFLIGAAAQLAEEGQLRVKVFSTPEMQALPFQWTRDHFAVHFAFHSMLPCCEWSENPTEEFDLDRTLNSLASGRFPEDGYCTASLWRLHCAAIESPLAVVNSTWLQQGSPRAVEGPHPGGTSFSLVEGEGVWGQISDMLGTNVGELKYLVPERVLSETRRATKLLPGEPLITFTAGDYSD